MNQVNLQGRTVKAPEMSMAGELKIAKFTLAVDAGRDKNGKDYPTNFIDCVVFGYNKDGKYGLATTFEKYVGAGQRILVTGSLKIEAYDSKKLDAEGKPIRRKSTTVILSNMEFSDGKRTAAAEAPVAAEALV